jgi:hypothetical protein
MIVLPVEIDAQGKPATLNLRPALSALFGTQLLVQAVTVDGQVLTSPKSSVRYADNRLTEAAGRQAVTVHWYAVLTCPFAQRCSTSLAAF